MKFESGLPEESTRPLSFRRRFLAKALPVLVFFFIFPMILFILPKVYLDLLMNSYFNFPSLLNPIVRLVLAGVLILIGVFFLLWAIIAQRKIGKGTPMPLQATQKLVIQGPYSYCRNPLFFGLIYFFIGISLVINSIGSLMMVVVFSVIVLLYVKLIEEKELKQRFGNAYEIYKKGTPFLIPRVLRK